MTSVDHWYTTDDVEDAPKRCSRRLGRRGRLSRGGICCHSRRNRGQFLFHHRQYEYVEATSTLYCLVLLQFLASLSKNNVDYMFSTSIASAYYFNYRLPSVLMFVIEADGEAENAR